MAFTNPRETVTYVHPDWQKGSSWKFKKYKTLDDGEAILAATITTDVQYDIEKAREAKRHGERYNPKISQETLMSAIKALLSTMSRGWEGPEFTVPEDFTDDEGNPHPLAGKLAPCTGEWIGLMSEDQLADIEVFLDSLYAGRTAEEQAEFREGGGSVAQPNGHKARKGLASVS